MAITAPYSLELAKNDDAIKAVADDTVTTVAGKMKIYLGDNVVPGKRTSYMASLKNCFNRLMNDIARGNTGSGVIAVFGPWDNATSGNITRESGTGNVTADDVAIVCSGTFPDGQARNKGGSHWYQETFEQLLEVLAENTKSN